MTNLSPLEGSQASSLTWSVLPGGALPPGLALANGVISGTPTAEGTYQFQVQAELDATRQHHQTYSITVRQPLAVGRFEAARDVSGADALGGRSAVLVEAHAFRRERDVHVRDRLRVTSHGCRTRPRRHGVRNASRRRDYRATLRLSDSEGRTLDYAANFGVAARLKVGTLELRLGKVGRPYRSKVTATGGIAPRKWKITVGPLPKGIRFDRTTGILGGTPTKEGRYRLTFQVTDGLKVVATKKLRIDVLP